MITEEAVELSGMRGDDRLGGNLGEHRRLAGYAVEGVGVEHERGLAVEQQALESIGGHFVGADAGTDGYHLMGMMHGHVGDEMLVAVGLEHSLRHSRLKHL